jgi:hypothetical protein
MTAATTPIASSAAASSDPASRSAASWQARLAALKSRQVPDGDPRIIESRAALAFWRIAKSIDTAGPLSRPGADRLAVMLSEAARGGETR